VKKKPTLFAQKVYQLTKKIPRGKVTTYKAIAQALNTKAYQAVGQALRRNPFAPQVPCHRVIKSDGAIGGFNGQTKGRKITQKIKMLEKEGIEFKGKKIKNLDEVFFRLF
jgi:methylated-DNA-[protein]-cysteine S-methyltransferase